MLHNLGGERFEDVTFSGGFGHLQKGHGIAFADLDSDGDQDVIANQGAFFTGDFFKSVVFLNPHRKHSEPSELHRFIKIALLGVTANRLAIGARVAVTVTSPSLSEGGWFGMGSTMGTRTVHAVVSR